MSRYRPRSRRSGDRAFALSRSTVEVPPGAPTTVDRTPPFRGQLCPSGGGAVGLASRGRGPSASDESKKKRRVASSILDVSGTLVERGRSNCIGGRSRPMPRIGRLGRGSSLSADTRGRSQIANVECRRDHGPTRSGRRTGPTRACSSDCRSLRSRGDRAPDSLWHHVVHSGLPRSLETSEYAQRRRGLRKFDTARHLWLRFISVDATASQCRRRTLGARHS